MNTYILCIAFAFYLVSMITSWVEFARKKPISGKISYRIVIVAACFHLISIIVRYYEAGYTPITNFHETLSFLALCLAGFYLYLAKVLEFRAAGNIILLFITIIVGGALVNPSTIHPLHPVLNSFWLPVHTILAVAGNAVFLTAFLVSVLYLLIERQIKRKRLTISEKFPSLDTLDRINHICMFYGFPLLTAGIITGSIWAGYAWGSYWSWDPKETWSLVTWIVYAIIIHNRHTIGWRGRKTAYMMIIGFLFVLFSFVGINFLIRGLHSYV